MIDIKHPKCTVCGIRASYGIPCNIPSKCAQHKTDDMIAEPRKKCSKKNCNQIATYGLEKQNHCEHHKTTDEVYLVERKCKKCGTIDVLINDMCVNFCSLEEKANRIKKYKKLKEIRIVNILTEKYKKPCEYNVRVHRECGGKNSEEKEIGYDYGTHKIYIEVDENQHRSYCAMGEVNRMKNIYMNEGGVPIIFIRYNPDSFLTNGKKCKLSQSKKENELINLIKCYENVDNITCDLFRSLFIL